MKNHVLFLLALFAFSRWAMADTADTIDLQVRYGHVDTTYLINDDGTAVETYDFAMTVLKESAIEWVKHASVSYSTSAQKAEVLAAFTRKADGRRIEVPKDNYQIESNRGQGNDGPAFSDITTLSVVFPEVAVGDTVEFSYRLTQTEPLFPGHFSVAHDYPMQTAFDDVRVRIDYPASLWVQYEMRGMTEKEKAEKDGRKSITWVFSNPKPVKPTRQNFSVYDPARETGFSFSTFKSYRDISAAYGARATAKAAVTERITTLAAEIVKGRIAPRDQAQALYEWVARNITYGGNCIGVGAVVPRDLPVVLDNKMGDCKDHATLLQALLAARNIKSTQALVNSGSVYRLPKVPVVSTVNHVINYLPEFNLFLDSTSALTPFGMLPFQVEDKPVLLVDGFAEGLRTPPTPIGSSQQIIKSKLKVTKTGAITGSVDIQLKGERAAQTRAWARDLTRDAEADFVKNFYRSQGMTAIGKLSKDDPSALADSYHFKVDLNIEKFIKVPGPGAFYIFPLMNGGTSIQNMLGYAAQMEIDKDVDIACRSGNITEEYSLELPKTVKVLSIPKAMNIANSFVSYKSTYARKGNILTIRREIDDRTKGNVCSPQVAAAYKKIAEKVMDDIKAQVLYK